MLNRNVQRCFPLLSAAVIINLAIMLSACGGGSGSGNGNVTRNAGGPPAYSVGGSVLGLKGTLVLQNNSGDDLSLTADGSFTFATSLNTGDTYNITVLSQPSGELCTVKGGQGTIDSADINTVSIGCVPTIFTIGGSVFGLSGSLVLQNNGGDDLTLTANGSFTFASSLNTGDSYNITVLRQPDFEQCSIVGGHGSVSSSNVISVSVGCYPEPDLVTHSLNKTVKLTWHDTGAKTSYTLYYAPTPCDIKNIKSCNPTTINNIAYTGPQLGTDTFDVTNLADGQNYYFYLEGSIDGGYVTTSAVAGARPDVLSVDHEINAIATDANGNAYLGGKFTHIGTRAGRGVVVDAKHSGSLRGDKYPMIDDTYVHAVASDGNGGWYIGGGFTQVGGLPRNNLAHILADGSVDPNWKPSADNDISGITFDGTTIYVGGYFTTIDGKPRVAVAAIDTNGNLLDWAPSPGQTASNTITMVRSIAVSGGVVYIGGEFDNVTDTGTGITYTRNDLAAIKADQTGTVLDWNPNAGFDASAGAAQYIQAMTASSGIIYVAGNFSTFTDNNGTVTTRKNLAAINTDQYGTLNAWDPEPNYIPEALLVANNTLYVGGDFTQIAGLTRNHLAAFDISGSTPALSVWNPDINGSVSALAAFGNTIYASGVFSKVGGLDRDNAAAIKTDASATILDWNPILDTGAYSLAANANTVYIGGYLFTVGGVRRNHLAAIGPDEQLLDWNPDANNTVDTLTISNGVIYAGGKFTKIGGTSLNYVAAIGGDGSPQTWSPNPDGEVESIIVNGQYAYLGGKFTNVGGPGGVYTNGLAAVNTTNYGSPLIWLSIPDAGAEIRTLQLDGNTLYAGGNFSVSGTDAAGNVITASHLAAFDTGVTLNASGIPSTGGLNTNWIPNINTSFATNPSVKGAVNSLLVYGNTLYAGGYFSASYTPPNTTTPIVQNYLAALSTADASLQTNVSPAGNGILYALRENGGIIYTGSSNGAVDTQNGTGLAAFDPTTGAIQSLAHVVDGTVYALGIDTNTIYAGGFIAKTDSRFTYNLSVFPK